LSVKDCSSGRAFTTNPENILLEIHYYEADSSNPDNELEKMFGPYEGAYGNQAKELNRIAELMVDEEAKLEKLSTQVRSTGVRDAVRNFAAVSYFRTPAALKEMQDQLLADSHVLAPRAAQSVSTAYEMSSMGFSSTFEDRFSRLTPTYVVFSKRLITGDRACVPFDHSQDIKMGNSFWAIYNDPEMTAVMPLGPRLLVLYGHPERFGTDDRVIIGSDALAGSVNELVGLKSLRFIIE
jgi:hypothetical protein